MIDDKGNDSMHFGTSPSLAHIVSMLATNRCYHLVSTLYIDQTPYPKKALHIKSCADMVTAGEGRPFWKGLVHDIT
jgi:hypothetical protein